jgi:hypothetical protein
VNTRMSQPDGLGPDGSAADERAPMALFRDRSVAEWLLLGCGVSMLLGSIFPWYASAGATRTGFGLTGSPAAVTGAAGTVLVVIALLRDRTVLRGSVAVLLGAVVLALGAYWSFFAGGVMVEPGVASEPHDVLGIGVVLSLLAGSVGIVDGTALLGAAGGRRLTFAVVAASFVAGAGMAVSISGRTTFCGTEQFVARTLVVTVPLAVAAVWRLRATEPAGRLRTAAIAVAVATPLPALAAIQTLPAGICGD